MNQSFKILDLEVLKNTPLQQKPFPFMIIDNILQKETLNKVVADFPAISKRGSFPLSSIDCKGHFATLIEELQHPRLREIIGARFGMDLQDKPPMITVRGYTTERDGHIHVDSTSKLVTILLYLNPNWQSQDGCLRLLYNNHDLDNFVAEIPPEAGRCLIFKVTPNCWHGHKVFIGERRTIQLNYVVSQKAADHHLQRHRLSAFLKKLFLRSDANSTY